MISDTTIQPKESAPVYILSASAISPQRSFAAMTAAPETYTGDKLQCIEPDYTAYVDAKLIRRMSRIIKMGVAAASEALQQGGVAVPDAIITGTAYGCLADTDQFLTRMVEFKETLLSPTAFIQSTHNTVAAQIALMLQCHRYNNTYVHRGSSFEAALTDALSLLDEGDAQTILIGAADERTEKSHTILKRFGLYKAAGQSSNLINSNTKGTMAGDGACFFVLGSAATGNAMARLDSFKSYYKPQQPVAELVHAFLAENQLTADALDLVITGHSGDVAEDRHYNQVVQTVFPANSTTTYKQLCGEYPTSSAFACWMAAHILREKQFKDRPVKKLLIYNNYLLSYPAFYLLSAC